MGIFLRQYFSESQETDGGKTVEKLDLLVLTSDSGYELSFYERVTEGETSYTSEYFHMTGSYTREGNALTVEPGTLRTGWTNYEQTMVDGTWTVTDGALVLEMGNYTAAIAENAEGGLDITVNYGQMGEKTYTMTADQAKAILN